MCVCIRLLFCQFSCENVREYSTASLTIAEINNIHCSTLIHQVCHLITEGYWVGQAWFPLHKSLLSIPNHLLVLHLFGNSFQYYLLHHFLRDPDEPVIPNIFLLAFLEDRVESLFWFLLVLKNLSWLPSPSKNNWEWPGSDTSQFPQLSWVRAIRFPVCLNVP